MHQFMVKQGMIDPNMNTEEINAFLMKENAKTSKSQDKNTARRVDEDEEIWRKVLRLSPHQRIRTNRWITTHKVGHLRTK